MSPAEIQKEDKPADVSHPTESVTTKAGQTDPNDTKDVATEAEVVKAELKSVDSPAEPAKKDVEVAVEKSTADSAPKRKSPIKGASSPTKSKKPDLDSSNENQNVPEELQRILDDISLVSSGQDCKKESPKKAVNTTPTKVSTERLLSVLEGDAENKQKKAITTVTVASTTTTKRAAVPADAPATTPIKKAATATVAAVTTTTKKAAAAAVVAAAVTTAPKKAAVVVATTVTTAPKKAAVVVTTTPKKAAAVVTTTPKKTAAAAAVGPADVKPSSVDPSPAKTLPSSSGEKKLAESESKPETSKAAKRYIYKLKSKSGKILKYTSNTPIVLKKPVITLTKMNEESTSDTCFKDDDVPEERDSDNSSKENMRENDASVGTTRRLAKKKCRPPLSQKTPVFRKAEEKSASDAAGDSKAKTTPSSFGMTTRKRKLKFLPDGRIAPPDKKGRDDAGDGITETSSDSDVESVTEEDFAESAKKNVRRSTLAERKTAAATPSTSTAADKKGKVKKVFDFETFYREKTGVSPSAEVRARAEKSLLAGSKIIEVPKNKVSQMFGTPNSSTPKKATPVDPAQLLSSLIGVPITPSQLNIVKFKPKVIQERSSSVVPKKVTLEADKKMSPSTQSDLLKNTPYKVVSKPAFQKILPKPTGGGGAAAVGGSDRTPVIKRFMEHKLLSTSTPTPSPLRTAPTYSPVTPKTITVDRLANDTLTKFEHFTDSKIVKTKDGPKKVLKRKVNDVEDSPKTVYELLQHVFEEMPSWNLHVIPDTNSFCIAQVSRGRMGIPILKKSIEINGEFFAKVYVHQLHCKRYDGVYDSENKILSLIKEIDGLAA